MQRTGIAVIGRLAQGAELLDGQTVKTNMLYDELRRCYPEADVRCVDVYRYKKRLPVILMQTLLAFVRCEHIFVLLSRNGRRFFFPILTALNAVFRRRLYHNVIGGALPNEAAQMPALRRQLRHFTVNLVESASMQSALAQIGVTNVSVLPNFKRQRILSPEECRGAETAPFIFVTFSRVLREKGSPAAAEAVAAVNAALGAGTAQLRIYGPVDEEYRAAFDALLAQYADCVSYCGCISPAESGTVLADAYMLLFPSVYPGEGMPGTILDAYAAGLPVIATDWHCNAEFVSHGVTGWCYDPETPQQLEEWVRYAVQHPGTVNAMRASCLAQAHRYTPEAGMRMISEIMNLPLETED